MGILYANLYHAIFFSNSLFHRNDLSVLSWLLKKKQDSLIWMFLVYFQRQSEQLMQESRASVSHTECSERYFDLQSEYFPEIFLCLGEQGGGE